MNYICSNCGAPAHFDGRCGDGPVLVCECRNLGKQVDDGRGGWWQPLAYPIKKEEKGQRYNACKDRF